MRGITPNQKTQLDILDELAVLLDIDQDLQAVITRIANRAKTDQEGDDVAFLINCRRRLNDVRTHVAQHHKDCRF